MLKFGYAPGDLHFGKHGEVGGGVGGVGVEEGAVPVEEDAAEAWFIGAFHGRHKFTSTGVIGGAVLKADPTNSNAGRKTAEKDNAESAEKRRENQKPPDARDLKPLIGYGVTAMAMRGKCSWR